MSISSYFKILVIVLIFFISNIEAKAQADGIYRIKLLTVSKDSDLRIFNSLKDLGVVSYEPYLQDKLRVYLGNYIGKPTAEKIIPMVVQKGFKGASIEKKSDNFINEAGDSLTHTLQFTALKKLDIRIVLNNKKLDDSDKKEVMIWYHNGYYRVSFGLINQADIAYINKYKSKSTDLGYKDAFTQKFSGIVPVKENIVIQTTPKVTFPEVKKIEQKDKLEKELKKSTQNPTSKTTNPNPSLDPILVPKEAKKNPNAKLKPVK